jgi:predicted RNA-binding protein with TRAM domain
MSSRNLTLKFPAIPLAVAVLLAALGAAGVFAKGAREFAGFYRIVQATNQGDQVEVRISLRVFNYSQADVQDATISLLSSRPHGPRAAQTWEKEQPSFQGVVLRFNEHQVVPPLEGTFTVPVREYERWLKGAQPHFVIGYQDASGEPQHRGIELMRRP